MAENLIIEGTTKEEKYSNLFPQIQSVTGKETDLFANMANVASMLHFTFGFLWTGFYRVVGDELVLTCFQGPLACTRIKKGRGVCAAAFERKETIVVKDVNTFEGHIACSSLSQSEIVVPVFKNNELIAVLDIDSQQLNTFDNTDKFWLEKIVKEL